MIFQKNKLPQVQLWLIDQFTKHNCVTGLYIVGSSLYSDENLPNDVDVVQVIHFNETDEMDRFVEALRNIGNKFLEVFHLPLHITTFTQNEELELHRFLSLNNFIKLI